MNKQFKPLLASPVDLDKLKFPVLASPKLDGIRCVVLDGKALSRKLKPIPNDYVRTWIEDNLPNGMDGEILLKDPREPFNKVTSAIMSKDGQPEFVYWAFDWLQEINGWFSGRIYAISHWAKDRNFICGSNLDPFKIVPHTTVNNIEELTVLDKFHREEGWEGTMLRDPFGFYKFGRSTVNEGILLKMKQFEDEEAVVIGLVEEMANHNLAEKDNLGGTKRSSAKAGKVGKGVLGALQCKLPDGTLFEIGTGFTAKQREDFYNEEIIGKTVKFKHQPPPGGRKEGIAPRFPVWLGWRSEID